MKIAIIGAGNGGVAAAGELTLSGHEIRLFQVKEFAQSFEKIRTTGQIKVTGVSHQGTARLHAATHDPGEAIGGAQVVLVIAPSFAQQTLAELCCPLLEEGQYVFLIPGGFGSLIFSNTLKKLGVGKKIILGETSTLPYGARMVSDDEVSIIIKAVRNPFAALPAKYTAEAAQVLHQLYPETAPAQNVLDVALNNVNPVVHPLPSLLSAGRIEFSGGDFWLYREGMTPGVWKAMRALDRERVQIRKAFGLGPPHCELPEEVGKVFREQFGIEASTAGTHMKGPKSLRDRYFTEDIPMGLVLYSSLGQIANTPTPVTDSVISLAGALLGTDLRKTGRTLESMGLGDATLAGLLNLVS